MTRISSVWMLHIQACRSLAITGISTSSFSLQFSPFVKGSKRYMVSTGTDATVCFWQWDVNNSCFRWGLFKLEWKYEKPVRDWCSFFFVSFNVHQRSSAQIHREAEAWCSDSLLFLQPWWEGPHVWTAAGGFFSLSSRVYVYVRLIQCAFVSLYTGGMFLATGSTDDVIRIYYLGSGCPEKLAELDSHTVRAPDF